MFKATTLAQKLHLKGLTLREEDKHTEALKYLKEALIEYHKEGDFRGLIDALKDRCLTYKHFFLLTKDEAYAVLAKKDAEAMLKTAKEFNLKDKLSTSYFRLGEIAMLSLDYQTAINNDQMALKFFSVCDYDKGDLRYDLGEAVFQNGEKAKGKALILRGIEEIKKGQKGIDPFLIHVWLSGAFMRLAELLWKEDQTESEKYLLEAEKIIKNDSKLVIRKRQLEELKKSRKAI
jgi:tetratricopeptide (TPR) repeat protein